MRAGWIRFGVVRESRDKCGLVGDGVVPYGRAASSAECIDIIGAVFRAALISDLVKKSNAIRETVLDHINRLCL